MNDEQYAGLIEKVEAVARLMALSALSDKKTLADKVIALSAAGFRPKDVAWLLGREAQRINEILYQQRKRGAKSGSQKEATSDD